MNRIVLVILLLCSGISGAPNGEVRPGRSQDSLIYSSPSLLIVQLTDHVYMHTSYLQTTDFGKVPCNGMVVADKGEAVIFDTPANDAGTRELISFLGRKKIRIKAVIATHFHADCVAGLKEFHRNAIPSFAENQTIRLLRGADPAAELPEKGFNGSATFQAGAMTVYAGYFGQGHTRDNIVAYCPEEKVLFGGCLIKEAGAGKGNLADANIAAWAGTVDKVRVQYPDVRTVIPGHGKPGDGGLLAYTIRLFAK